MTGERGVKALRAGYPIAAGKEAFVAAIIMVAAGIILPYVVHAIGASPRVMLPMHFPVLIAGILLSPVHALIVGLVTPAISMGLTGFPTSAQVMRMMPELAAYALTTSLMLRLLPEVPGLSKRLSRLAAIAIAIIVAMIVGRLVYVGFYCLFAGAESFRFFMTVLIAPAIPGIVTQLILVPLIGDRIQRSM
jgi:hypothetical protein